MQLLLTVRVCFSCAPPPFFLINLKQRWLSPVMGLQGSGPEITLRGILVFTQLQSRFLLWFYKARGQCKSGALQV